MTMGATLGWPTTAILGFFLLTALVVALGTTSTARYEFERNGTTRERQRTRAESMAAHPSGRRESRPAAGERRGRSSSRRRSTSPCARRRPRRPAVPPGGSSTTRVSLVAGPFADQLDADWAALSADVAAVSVHGKRTADGA